MNQTPLNGKENQQNPVIYSFGQEQQEFGKSTGSFLQEPCNTKFQYVLNLIKRYESHQGQINLIKNEKNVQSSRNTKSQSTNRDKKQFSTGRYSPLKVIEFKQNSEQTSKYDEYSLGIQASHNDLVQRFTTPIRKFDETEQKWSSKKVQISGNQISQFQNIDQQFQKKIISLNRTSQIPLVESILMNEANSSQIINFQMIEKVSPILMQKLYKIQSSSLKQYSSESSELDILAQQNESNIKEKSQLQGELNPFHIFILCIMFLGFFVFWI